MNKENLKKLNVFFVLGLLLITSCKKNYTCSCLQTVTVPAYTYNGQNYPQQISFNTFTNYFEAKEKEAESICNYGESVNSYPSTYAAQGQGQTIETISCEIK